MEVGRRQFLYVAAGAAALPAASRDAWGQAYPVRPVRLTLGYAPGAAPDIVARLVGQALSDRLGRQFIIDNRPGAASNLAAEAVVRAPADGYTLLYCTTSNAINASIYDKLNFSFLRDIEPVAGVLRVPNLVSVSPSLPIKTIPELIAYAKDNPGKLNYGAGTGGSVLLTECSLQDDGRRQHRPRPLQQSDAGGDGRARRPDAGQLRRHADDDRICQSRQAAAAWGDDRGPLAGAARDSRGRRLRAGLRGKFMRRWRRRLKKTPAAIIERVNAEVNAVIADPMMKMRMAELGGVPMPMASPPSSRNSSPTRPRNGATS